MIEILDMKDVKDATPEILLDLVFVGKDSFRKPDPKEFLGNHLLHMKEPEHRWLLPGIDGQWRASTPHTAERRYSWECIIRTILLDLVLKDGQNVRLRKG